MILYIIHALPKHPVSFPLLCEYLLRRTHHPSDDISSVPKSSIVLDNSDGKLPIVYSEAIVTRRIYRSGESGYFINKTPCRLKDILELFMDTGIGKDGYSIIGQGKIVEILSIKSEDL